MANNREDFAHTKVVWTLSPASLAKPAPHVGTQLVENKVDAILTVFSKNNIKNIQDLRNNITEKLSHKNFPEGHIPFLFSLIGRRAFCFFGSDSMDIEKNQHIEIQFVANIDACLKRMDPIGGPGIRVVTSAADVFSKIVCGSKISFGYGEIEIKIVSIKQKTDEIIEAQGEVLASGTLFSGTDVASPDLEKGLFPLAAHDKEVLEQRLHGLADGLIVHGVTTLEDFHCIKDAVDIKDKDNSTNLIKPLLLFRVDSASALELLPQIFEKIDGVFLNRSELGTSLHPNSLPLVQKDLIAQCHKHGKLVMVSSDLLASMKKNPNPTRAEVSDLANLVLDGVDAVVLGREVTEGMYAKETAYYCRETIINSEKSINKNWNHTVEVSEDTVGALAYAALHAAKHVDAKALVCLTRTGLTAGRLASMQAPIEVIALTYNSIVMRQTQLLRSVRSLVIDKGKSFEELFVTAKDLLASEFGFGNGDKLVFVSLRSLHETRYDSNLFLIEEYTS